MAMKTAQAVMIFMLSCTWGAVAQMPAGESPAPQRVQVEAPAANLDAILQQIQQATNSASVNIGKLRIEKWKTDPEQKQQLNQIADSLQKNIANAVPGLINDVQSSRGGVLASFKLYHNLNVLYEFLSSLTEAAGALGKKDEYEPLAANAAAVDSARQSLSSYIEQAAARMETVIKSQLTAGQARPSPTPTPKKVVVEGDLPAHKPTKPPRKKTAAPAATPSPTPPGSPQH